MTIRPPLPPLQTFTVNQQTMAARAFNPDAPGTPVIFLHGILSSLNFWVYGQTPAIQSRRWYTLSLPGHYPAVFPRGFQSDFLTAEFIAETVGQAVRHLVGESPVILAGHSTGGFAALAAAACLPEQVCGVISVSGFAHGRWTGALGLAQWIARLGLPGRMLFHANLRTLAADPRLFTAGFRVYVADARALYTDPGLPATGELLFADLQGLSADAMLAYFRQMPTIDITAWLPRITAPALILTGDADPIVPPDQSRLIAGQLPGSTLVILPGAGHIPMSERAAGYHAAVSAWLEQHG